MGESFGDFSIRVRKAVGVGKRSWKIRNSYGMRDYFFYYRKTRPRNRKYVLSEKQFYDIYTRVGPAMADLIAKGLLIKFPYRLGLIYVHEIDTSPRLNKEGKVLFPSSIDFLETLKLWYEDEDAKKDKILIKSTIYKHPHIRWDKRVCNFRNQMFYKFIFNRLLRKKVRREYDNGNLKILYK